MAHGRVPGVLVLAPGSVRPDLDVRTALVRAGLAVATVREMDGSTVATWGLASASTPDAPLLLSGTNWSDHGSVDDSTVARWLASDATSALRSMLPPFAVLGRGGEGLVLATDAMGFRQVYLARGEGWTALSTSARLLGVLGGTGLDEEGLLVQSQLGWQLGQRTLFAGVAKLAPGEVVHLSGGRVQRDVAEDAPEPIRLEDAVNRAAAILRELLERYLDENPDPTLQLTGGQDSRLILSAIPPRRRQGLKVMTLGVPGTGDAELAADLARRYGMHHTVRTLDGLGALAPREAFDRVLAAALRLDCMADPLARAATLWAEESFRQGARLSGLGGEIARGFYYTGRVQPTPLTRERVDRLAAWRMLANEAVEPGMLGIRLAGQAPSTAVGAIYNALAGGGEEWYSATDELYYHHRMQRWAGLGESAVCFDRSIVNPMLDHRFVAIARGLSPQDKKGSRFLALLQVALDEELASIRLDNRPPPRAYTKPSPANLVRLGAAGAAAATRKIGQRVRGARRPPPGGAVLAGKVVEYLRQDPGALDGVRELEVLDPEWLDRLRTSEAQPSPASLALLINLIAATDRSAPGSPHVMQEER